MKKQRVGVLAIGVFFALMTPSVELSGVTADEVTTGRKIVAATLAAIERDAVRRHLESLSVGAECRGDDGPFMFEVETIFPDHLAWRRIDGHRIREVVVVGDLAWSIDDGSGRSSLASSGEVVEARRHDFIGLLLGLDRFQDARLLGRESVEIDGDVSACLRVRLSSDEEQPIEVCIDEKTSLLLNLEIPSPDGLEDSGYRWNVTSWMPWGPGYLPRDFTLQKGQESAACRYQWIDDNRVRPEIFALPPDLGVPPPVHKAWAFDCEAAEQISAEECRALVALYAATDGDRWRRHEPATPAWLDSVWPCDWEGVACTEVDGRSWVVGIDLGGRRLNGVLPAELAGLRHLRWLRLGGNELSGEIPAALGELAELSDLNLSHNQLSGSIPAELGGLAALEVLNLSSNRLSGEIPPSLARLPRLREVSFALNRLTGEIPPALVASPSLKHLAVWDNALRGTLPVEIGPFLESFSFWNNPLHGLIPETYHRFRFQENRLRTTHLCIPSVLEPFIENRRYFKSRQMPCLETSEDVAAWRSEQEAELPRYAVLEEPAEFLVPRIFSSLSGPIHYPGGERASMPYREEIPAGSLVRRTANRFALLDLKRLATRDHEPATVITRDVSLEEARRRVRQLLDDGLVVLGVFDGGRLSDYVLTLLGNGELVDYSIGDGFEFLHQLLVSPGEMVELYQDGRHVGRARVAESLGPPSTGGPRLEITEVEALAAYSRGRPLLFALRPLAVTDAFETPDFSELLIRPNDSVDDQIGPIRRLSGRVDLDGDGVAELIFREIGRFGIHFSVFRHIDGRWQVIYRGGGWAGC